MSAAVSADPRTQLIAQAMGSFQTFCSLVDIISKGAERQKLAPLNEIQRRYCQERTQRDVVLKPRQIGFTTMEQARDIYFMLTRPNAQVVVVCQSSTEHDAQKLLSRNYRIMFEGLQRAGVSLVFSVETNTEWVLAGRNSRLRIIEAGASEAAAEKKGRGGNVLRVHLTETAMYEYAQATLNALLESVPHISKGSEVVSESTPNGASGYFYNQCKAAERRTSGYKLHFYPWFDVAEYSTPLDPGEQIFPQDEAEDRLFAKGVTPEQLKWRRQKIASKGGDGKSSKALFDQEYPSDPDTCFLLSGRTFFDATVTEKLLSVAHAPPTRRDRDRISIWRPPVKGRDYILAIDTSEGGGGDDSAGILGDYETGEHVATILGQYTPFDLAGVAAEIATEYNEATLVVERNNHGHAVIQELVRHHRYKQLYEHPDKKHGWPTTAVTRPVMLDDLENAHSKGLWTTPDRNVALQMRTFVVNANGRPEAAPGEHDDLVIAAAIMWAVRQRPRARNAYSQARSYRAGLPKARE